MNQLIKEKKDNPKYKPFQKCNEDGFFDEVRVAKTPHRKGKESENSLMFSGKPETAIRNAFKITDTEFSRVFKEACSGDGMEERRIATLHSSSLLSLLFFHTVNDANPIVIDCANRGKGRFTVKRFEHRNPIVPGHCSNIDIRLDDVDAGLTLFLESKYSEYLNNGKYSGISGEVYLEYYRDILPTLEHIGLTVDKKDTESFELSAPSGRTRHYAGGIKQMISHWIGAVKYAETHEENVWLGEVVFDFGKEQAVALDRYRKDYALLAEGLNKSKYTPDNLIVLPQLMTYQELYDLNRQYVVPKRIEDYYNFSRTLRE